jgi:hypothetical protein
MVSYKMKQWASEDKGVHKGTDFIFLLEIATFSTGYSRFPEKFNSRFGVAVM